MKKFLNEFKQFISRGNVLDLAVAVVVGNAFNAIISSLVNDIIMPFIGIIIGGVNFSSLTLTIGESTILFGSFIQHIIDFLIIAFSIFVVVKMVNKITCRKKKEEKVEVKKSDDIILLEEIRDLLKENKK